MSLDVYLQKEVTKVEEIFAANITHNLARMARAAGGSLYEALWSPEKLQISKAAELIPILETGLANLKEDPELFRKYNPTNGWGSYEDLVNFVERYLNACRNFPDAEVAVWA